MNVYTESTPTNHVPYFIGAYDRRPWGAWMVTDTPSAGDGSFCEKIIVVSPNKILSLQSHNFRSEDWTVLDGTLTVIVNGQYKTLLTGEKIHIPKGAVHCMANLGLTPCTVKERQTGQCAESDIKRYIDSYNRPVVAGTQTNVMESICLYHNLVKQMKSQEKHDA